jgi:hypothetical protein
LEDGRGRGGDEKAGARGVDFKPRTAHPQADTPPDVNDEEYESADYVMVAPLVSSRKDIVVSSYKKTLGTPNYLWNLTQRILYCEVCD